MNIMPSIFKIVKALFSELFDSVEPFYLKDTLILVQGILNGEGSSLNRISRSEANRVSHTTLARFLSGHVEFWDRLEAAVRKYLLDARGNVFIVDDTQLKRSSKKIPFVKRNYDHVNGRYEDSQVLVVIGKLVEGEFMALEMKFFDKAEGTKSDAVVRWLKSQEFEGGTVLVGDSWYTHSEIIEWCKRLGTDMVGRLKSNLKMNADGKTVKVGRYQKEKMLDREGEISGKRIKYREEVVRLESVRMPLKVVVEEMNGKRATICSTDVGMSPEKIIETYLSRWSVENYFKMAKQDMKIGECRIRNEDGQNHWMVLASMAHLVFRVMRKILEAGTKDEAKRWIRMAIESFVNEAVETVRAKAKGLRLMLKSGADAYFMNPSLTP